MRSYQTLVLALTAVVATSACGDSPLASAAAAGYYRLSSVDGQALPFVSPPSGGFVTAAIDRGDLVLRGDRTFGLGIGGTFGGVLTGRFRVARGELLLTLPAFETGLPATELAGEVDGDSVAIDLQTESGTRRFVFRRSQRDPVAVSPGLYTLATVDGRGAPFTLTHEVVGTGRYTTRIVFDSITFVDAVFYRRHQSEEMTFESTGGQTSASGSSSDMMGAYGGSANAVILTEYYQSGNEQFAIVGSMLVRTMQFFDRTIELRYQRR